MKIEITTLEAKAEILRAAAHPLRIAILYLLQKEKECTVSQIYAALQIEQAVASHHLRILKMHQLVVLRKSGKNAYYSPNKVTAIAILKAIDKIDLA